MKDIIAELKRWRREKGLSQAAAAAALGVSVRTLQEWEQGRRRPRGLGAEELRGRMK